MITIPFYINGQWTPVTGATNSACYDEATRRGATKAHDQGWLAVYLGQEWVYLTRLETIDKTEER